MKKTFAKKMIFRKELADGTHEEKNAYVSWRVKLEDKPWYLIGWCDSAFAIVDKLGAYNFTYISGSPEFLFKEA